MSYINRFLKQSGVATPYKDDRTGAQIDEANKQNPLSGYGFMSAQQKSQRELQMKLLEAQQKREQEMMQQQLLARMSSQEKIGHYAGAGLMGLMQHLRSKGDAPQPPPQAPQDDPELQRYNQLAQEVGPETALEILGRETGNASMITEAGQQRTAKKKEGLEMQNIESLIADRAKETAKPNNVITAQRTGPNGQPMQVSMEVYGKDPTTGQNLYKELGEAIKGSVQVDDPSKFDTSKGGSNERTKNMEAMLTSTANALDSYDLLGKLVKDTPAGGWSGALTAKAEDIVSGVQNLSTLLTDAGKKAGWDVSATKDIGAYNWSALENFAGANAKIKSLVLELAYARAAATGDSSRSLSDRDVQNQLDQIGGSISNPRIFGQLMEQNKQLMIKKLQNFGEMTMIDGKSIGQSPQYAGKIKKLTDRVGIQSGVTRVMYRNNQKYNIPEDEVEAFKAAGGSESR